jgi:hypothetical protein
MNNNKHGLNGDKGCLNDRLAKLNEGDNKSNCYLDMFIAKTKYQLAKQKS